MSSVPHLSSIVAGVRYDGDETFLDINPAEPETHVAIASFADAELATRAVEAAAASAAAWRRLPAPARGDFLRRGADLLQERSAEVARDLAREEGKTLREAAAETARAVAIFRYYAAQTLDPDGETFPSHSPTTFLYARREPLGVVTVITPWNFPIAIPAWKIAPALAFGNTVVWKPAEIVPLTATHLLRALEDAGLPAGVLNLVLGRGSVVGAALVAAQPVNAITFTGSNDVGTAIQRLVAGRGTKLQLELGGKNAAVVLADADLDLAAEQIARGAFLSAGQKCTATSRVIVERSVADDLAERLAAIARSWPVGDPLDESTMIGPLSSREQLETVVAYLELAEREHARFVSGGNRVGTSGFFLEPTILADLPSTSAVAREEIFGPVAVLLQVDSFEEAVALANDTPFGLTSALFTRDLARAIHFAHEIRTGVVKVNQESAGLEYHVPFGGMRQSSNGSREQGKVARDFFTQWKTVYLDAPL